MNKRFILNIIAFTLLGIGVVSGLLILYDQTMVLHLIPKEQALQIAMHGFPCTDKSNGTRGGSIEILHVKNNTLFAVDERTMQDMALTDGYNFREHPESKYFYLVHWECYLPHTNEGAYWYGMSHYIDAKNGKLLE